MEHYARRYRQAQTPSPRDEAAEARQHNRIAEGFFFGFRPEVRLQPVPIRTPSDPDSENRPPVKKGDRDEHSKIFCCRVAHMSGDRTSSVKRADKR